MLFLILGLFSGIVCIYFLFAWFSDFSTYNFIAVITSFFSTAIWFALTKLSASVKSLEESSKTKDQQIAKLASEISDLKRLIDCAPKTETTNKESAYSINDEIKSTLPYFNKIDSTKKDS